MRIRVISWNIELRGSIEKKIDYLQSVIHETDYPTVIALQEVREADREYMRNNAIFDKNAYSLDIRKPGPFDTTNRKLGCLIGITGGAKILDSGIMERVPFPDRTVFVDIQLVDLLFQTVCFHSLTGVGYKKAKTAQFTGIAEHLHYTKQSPTICCFDANEPMVDHYDMDKVEFFSQGRDRGVGAARILGKNPVHNMRDSYRKLLENNKEELNKIKYKQDNAEDEKALKYIPLATSHIINNKFHKRYDYIFTSDEFMVKNVEYRLEEALNSGSDHAMVVGDFHYH